MVHQVLADGVVDAGHERDAEFRSDTVGAGDQHRVMARLSAEMKETAERSEIRQDARRRRSAREAANSPNHLVAGIDVDARLLIVHRLVRGRCDCR